MTWSVPINDAKFVAFDVTNTPLQGEDARRYAAVRAEEQERQVDVRWDLADKILAGEMTLEDLPQDMDPYTSFAIEDYVTQVGQGAIRGRDKEMLGSTDVKPVLLRRLWLRELTAMLEGKPMTEWKFRRSRSARSKTPDAEGRGPYWPIFVSSNSLSVLKKSLDRASKWRIFWEIRSERIGDTFDIASANVRIGLEPKR